jgi:hypothetical protein
MINYKDPAALRELMEKVTSGPWEAVNHYDSDDSEATAAIVDCESQRMVAEVDPSFEGYEDAQFIALSREALPYWIDHAEQLNRAVERLLDALDHGARCPQAGMWDECHDYGDRKCRACRKAWAMKEDK